MRNLLAILYLLIAPHNLHAQDVFINMMSGLTGNTGVQSKIIKGSGKGYAGISGDLYIMGDDEYIQAGGGLSIMSINNKTVFLFEQDILPDKRLRNTR